MVIQTLQSLFVSSNNSIDKKPWSRSPCLIKSWPRDGLCQSGGFFQIDRSKWCLSHHRLKVLIPRYLWKRKSQIPVLNFGGWHRTRALPNKTNAFPSIVNGETGWLSGVGGTSASYLFNKEKSLRSEKAIMKFISQESMGLRSKARANLVLGSHGCDPDGEASPRTLILSLVTYQFVITI